MKYLTAFVCSILSSNCLAGILWSDVSASLLKGNNYQVGDNNRTVFTFEHAAGYSWGDSFLFIDRLQSNNGNKETYAEIAPRFQLSAYQNKLIKNIYLATTIEIGNDFTHYLYGIGTQLKLPHFKYFNINLYHRNNDSGANSQQITLTWALPFNKLLYDGFIDFVPSNDNKSTSLNFTSQLKYSLSEHLNLATKLYVGVEYNYWLNKFGIDGIDEKNLNFLVKYHF